MSTSPSALHHVFLLIAGLCLAAPAALAQTPAHRASPPRAVIEARAATAPAPARPCLSGYLWRQAGAGDAVCVEPWARDRVRRENADDPLHAERARPGRPPQCLAGYVFREAFPHDLVCVTPAAHAQAQDENVLGPSRRQP